MTVQLASPQAGRITSTSPLVEPDGKGGHVPYVRLDTTPDGSGGTLVGLLLAVLAELRALRAEVQRLRLGLVAASDSVCVDIEGELTPATSED